MQLRDTVQVVPTKTCLCVGSLKGFRVSGSYRARVKVWKYDRTDMLLLVA